MLKITVHKHVRSLHDLHNVEKSHILIWKLLHFNSGYFIVFKLLFVDNTVYGNSCLYELRLINNTLHCMKQYSL